MEILRCEHLCKQYGTGNACVKALDDVSFSVEKGEFVSIIGPSGSGKSTLLHILGGVDRPTSGKVFVNGTELHSLKEDQLAIFRRRQIGLVYQFYNLLPVLTVDENIMLPHLLDGHPKDQGRLDQVVGGGDHPQPHHKGQAHRAGTVGVAGGCLKINGDKVHMLVGGKGERLFVANIHGGSLRSSSVLGFAGGTGRNTSPSADPFLL